MGKSVLEWYYTEPQVPDPTGPFKNQEEAWAAILEPRQNGNKVPVPIPKCIVYCVRREVEE